MKKTFLTGSLVGLFVMLFLATTVSADTPPTDPTDLTLTTGDVKVTETLTGTCTDSTDADNDTIIYFYQFYNNNDATERQAYSSDNTYVIASADAHDVIRVRCLATTSDANSSTYDEETKQIANTAPTISPRTITIESHEDSKEVILPASDADGDTLTYGATPVNPLLAECTILGTKLTVTRVNDSWKGTTECTVTVSDGHGGTDSEPFTIEVNRKSMLEIDDLDVYVDGEKDSNVKNGDKIGEDVHPDSTVKFEFKIKNLYDEDDEELLGIDERDMEIEDIFITVTIKNIDDDGDDDLEEETKEFDLDPKEKSSTKSLEFDIPMDVDDQDYDVEITVEGEDGDGNEHKITWGLTLEVEKEKHDMKLKRAEFDQSTLSCDRETTFYVKLVNFGSSDEDELILTIQNTALEINIKEEDIEIDEGDDWSRSYTITVGDDVSPGTYKVITKMYYDSSDYYDKDFELSAYGSTNLLISKCVVTTPEEEEEEEVPEEEEEGEIIIITPEEEGEEEEAPTGGEVTREISFMDTSLYLVLLVASVVILAGIFLAMIFRLFPRR